MIIVRGAARHQNDFVLSGGRSTLISAMVWLLGDGKIKQLASI